MSNSMSSVVALPSFARLMVILHVAPPRLYMMAPPLTAARVLAFARGPLGSAVTIESLGLAIYSAGRHLIGVARTYFPFDGYQILFCMLGDHHGSCQCGVASDVNTYDS